MKSVGEVMAIGRTFTEALGKALRGSERRVRRGRSAEEATRRALGRRLGSSSSHGAADAAGTVDEVAGASRIDPWFVDQIALMAEASDCAAGAPLEPVRRALRREAPRPVRRPIAARLVRPEAGAAHRDALGVEPCSRPSTPARASSGRGRRTTTHVRGRVRGPPADRPARDPRRRPEPHRPGIEFDYACVHAAYALESAGSRP
jgi:carbamoyl-phosphate synthase large subunit